MVQFNMMLNRPKNLTKTYARTVKPKIREEIASRLSISAHREIPVEYESVCRLCLDKSDIMMDIFGDNESIVPIITKIQSLLSLEVNADDDLPTLICNECLHQLNEAYNFKKRCLASDVTLRQYLWPAKRLTCEATNDSEDTDLNKTCLQLSKEECTITEWDEQFPVVNLILTESSGNRPAQNLLSQEGTEKPQGSPEQTSSGDLIQSDVSLHRSETGNELDQINVEPPSNVIQSDDEILSKLDDVPLNERCAIEESKAKSKSKVKYRVKMKKEVFTECEICKAVLPSVSAYWVHWRKCSRRNPCPQCCKTFLSRSALKRHTLVHTGERPFVCNLCTKTFNQKEILLRHTAQIHSKEKPFQCERCSKRFALLLLLTEHMKLSHGDTIYKCQLCPKEFRHPSGLSRHMSYHKGTKYSCKVCGKKFSDSSSVNRHVKTHNIPPPSVSEEMFINYSS